MTKRVYQELSSLLIARANCEATGNTDWFVRHSRRVDNVMRNLLPSGAGIDTGTTLDLDKSKPDRLVLVFAYHHMNETGHYDGWTEHTAVVTPSLAHGFRLRITGRNRNQIKEYLHQTFQEALEQQIFPASFHIKGEKGATS